MINDLSRRQFVANLGATSIALSTIGSTLSAGTSRLKKKKIVIIGAGMSGISAARALGNDHEVVILEARDRVGGRIVTDTETFGSTPIDLGAMWIHGINGNPIYEMARKNKLNLLPTKDNISLPNTYSFDGKKYSSTDRIQLEEDFESLMMRFNLIVKKSRPDLNVSVKKIMDQILFDSGYSVKTKAKLLHMIASEVENEYAIETDEISAKFFSQGTTFSGDDVIITNGYSALLETLTQHLTIHFSSPVTHIDYSNAEVTITTRDGKIFVADHAIVTVPLGVLKEKSIQFIPDLPPEKTRAIGDLGFGNFMKVFLEFDHVFWPSDQVWLEYVGKDPEYWPMYLNVSKYSKLPMLATFVVGKLADALEAASDSTIVASATDPLRQIFGNSTSNVRASKITRWRSDPFSRGSYSFCKIGSDPSAFDILGHHVKQKVFFAGEATSSQNCATTHAAYLSGVRVAAEINAM